MTNFEDIFFELFDTIKHPYFQQIQVVKIDQATIKHWLDDRDFCFRLKIKAIEYYFDVCNRDLLFFDGDTYLLGDISYYSTLLYQKRCILYQKIRRLDTIMKQLNICYENFYDIGTGEVLFQSEFGNYIFYSDMFHYNCGIIGLSHEYACFLPEILALSDLLYEKTKSVCSEEFAFSYFLQVKYPLHKIYTANKNIVHYVMSKSIVFLLGHVFDIKYEVFNYGLRNYLKNIGIDLYDFYEMNLQFEDVYYTSIMFEMHIKNIKITIDNMYLYMLSYGFYIPDRTSLYRFFFCMMKTNVGKALCSPQKGN